MGAPASCLLIDKRQTEDKGITIMDIGHLRLNSKGCELELNIKKNNMNILTIQKTCSSFLYFFIIS